MGNWRIVEITGTCPPDQVNALRAACELEYPDFAFEQLAEAIRAGEELPVDPHCLSWTQRGSLCGLERWVAEEISSSGNVGKDVDEEEVAEALADLAQIAPGLRVVIHMGGDRESEECVSAVMLGDDGVVIGPPLIDIVRGVGDEEIGIRMERMLNEETPPVR